MKKWFVLETVDDIIIGKTNAKAFDSDTLGYIPGSTVMGTVCSLYGRDEFEADTLNLFFQENMAVFSDFLPLTADGKETLPAPMCLHKEKSHDRNKAEVLLNFLNPEAKESDRQYNQIRGDNRDSRFGTWNLKQTVTARTAIDYDTDTAKKSALYNRNSIARGQCFLGYCLIPDSLEQGRSDNGSRTSAKVQEARKAVFEILREGSVLRIGASRGSEYGRVRVHDVTHLMEQDQVRRKLPDPGAVREVEREGEKAGERELVLWCLSNAEFLDAVTSYDSGTPDNPGMLWALERHGITAKFNPKRSFIRTGKTRFFNNARGGLDSAKVYISRGSVLVYDYVYSGEDLPEILGKLEEEGIGISRQLGFGRVLVNPPFLVSGKAVGEQSRLFESDFSFVPDDGKNDAYADEEKSRIFKTDREVLWLKDSVKCRNDGYETDKFAGIFLNRVLELYKFARKYCGVANETDFGPGNTQWQYLKDLLRQLSFGNISGERLRATIKKVTVAGKENSQNGENLAPDDIWNIYCQFNSSSNEEISFGDAFAGLVEKLQREAGQNGREASWLVCKAIIRCIELKISLHDPRIFREIDKLQSNDNESDGNQNKDMKGESR